MKQVLFCILFLITLFPVAAQFPNLVPNPGFEEFGPCTQGTPPPGDTCLSSCNKINLPRQWKTNSATYNWYSANENNVYYFTSCNTFQVTRPESYWYTPHSGDAFIILMTYHPNSSATDSNSFSQREYAQVKLKEPLKAGCFYEVSFHYKPIGTSGLWSFEGKAYVTDHLGVFFSEDSFYYDHGRPLTQYIPQVQTPPGVLLDDTLHYNKFTDTFRADGGERYLTLGSFKWDDQVMAKEFTRPGAHGQGGEYYIDDVSVRLVPPEGTFLDLPEDTVVCDTSTLALPVSAQAGFDSYLWNTGDTTRSITITPPRRLFCGSGFWLRDSERFDYRPGSASTSSRGTFF